MQQRLKLEDVQIVGGGQPFQAGVVLEIIRRQRVGHIQRKIAHAAAAGEKSPEEEGSMQEPLFVVSIEGDIVPLVERVG